MQLTARMALMAIRPSSNTTKLVKVGTRYVAQMEATLAGDTTLTGRKVCANPTTPASPPCSARQLWESPDLPAWEVWGHIVNALWSVAMSFDVCCPEWQAITSRMLLWRAISGEGEAQAEWVRKQAVLTLIA